MAKLRPIKLYLLLNKNPDSKNTRGMSIKDNAPTIENTMKVLSFLMRTKALKSEIAEFIGKKPPLIGPLLRNHYVPSGVVKRDLVDHASNIFFSFDYDNVFPQIWSDASPEVITELIKFLKYFSQLCFHWDINIVKEFYKEPKGSLITSLIKSRKKRHPDIDEKWFEVLFTVLNNFNKADTISKLGFSYMEDKIRLKQFKYPGCPEQLIIDLIFASSEIINPFTFEEEAYKQGLVSNFHFSEFVYFLSKKTMKNQFKRIIQSDNQPAFIQYAIKEFGSKLWLSPMLNMFYDVTKDKTFKHRLNTDEEFKNNILEIREILLNVKSDKPFS